MTRILPRRASRQVATAWARRLVAPPRHGEAGDVPGWVMITVMSAGVVALLTAIAGPELARILSQALASVGG